MTKARAQRLPSLKTNMKASPAAPTPSRAFSFVHACLHYSIPKASCTLPCPILHPQGTHRRYYVHQQYTHIVMYTSTSRIIAMSCHGQATQQGCHHMVALEAALQQGGSHYRTMSDPSSFTTSVTYCMHRPCLVMDSQHSKAATFRPWTLQGGSHYYARPRHFCKKCDLLF